MELRHRGLETRSYTQLGETRRDWENKIERRIRGDWHTYENTGRSDGKNVIEGGR